MNYFLILIILGLCGGGYYEYNNLQQQVTELSGKVDSLQTENTKLTEDKTELAKALDDAKNKINDMSKQSQPGLSASTESPASTPQPTTSIPVPNPAAPATTTNTASGNNLGTITTLDGKTYENCKLLKVRPDCIVINYAHGITQIMFGLMPPDLQKRFGFDPHLATALSEAQVEAAEQARQAAAQTGEN